MQAEQFAKAAISTSPADALTAIVVVKPKASANATNNTQVVNPDDVDQTENVVAEDVIQAKDPQTAAWASYLQALLGTAEFRYLP